MRTAFFVLCSLVVSGCAPSETPMPPLYPVSGTITHKGKPVEGGMIFMPETPGLGSLIVNANVKDGKFTMETSRTKTDGSLEQLPGSPVGTYKAIYHPISNGATMGLEVEFPDLVKIEATGPNTLSFTLPDEMPKGQGAPRDDAK